MSKENNKKPWVQQSMQTLPEDVYYVTQLKGTEKPFSGQYNMHFEDGTYTCVCCGEALFNSSSKFNAGCGWPSFDQSIHQRAIKEETDLSHGMVRTEITCNNCNAHLGHVFDDGPTQTGLRYCVNSLSLNFKPK